MSLRLNFFTPTKKPIGYAITADGRRKRVYDKPGTPWQRCWPPRSSPTSRPPPSRIAGIQPADLTRQINQIQHELTALARAKTDALTANRHLDMTSLKPSIRRLQTTSNRKPRAYNT